MLYINIFTFSFGSLDVCRRIGQPVISNDNCFQMDLFHERKSDININYRHITTILITIGHRRLEIKNLEIIF